MIADRDVRERGEDMRWLVALMLLVGCVPMDRSVVMYRASTAGAGEVTAAIPLLQMPSSMNAFTIEVGSDLDDVVVAMIGIAYEDEAERGGFAVKFGSNMSRFGNYSRLDLELMSFHKRAVASAGISGVEADDTDFRLDIEAVFGVGVSF